MNKLEFGEYLHKLRTDRNISLRNLADMIEISPYYLSFMENGKKVNPSIEIMKRIFKTLKMSKQEIEQFLDYHAYANDCVSYDIVDFIMENTEVREAIRMARDKQDSHPNWDDFLEKIKIK